MTLKPGRVLCGTILFGALATTAFATTPETGTVSKAAPKVEWVGATMFGYATRMPTAVSGSTDTPCEAPSCETFTLTVADSATLTVAESIDSDSENAAFTMRITKPDGEIVQTDSEPGAAANKYVKVVIKNAPTGDYVIEHYDNAAAQNSFKAYAELAVPGVAAPAAPTTPVPPTTTTPKPAPTTTVQAIDLKVKVGKASARKLARTKKLPVKVTVSREVASVTATLLKGKKVVGKGSLAKTSGSATLNVKPKKLKKGAYSLVAIAKDAAGTSTTKTVKVKVSK